MSKETLNYIWGLDLSMSNTGISIFDKIGNPVFIGSIPTNKDFSHGKRLKEIYDYLSLLKDKYYPDILCIERGFNRFNKSSEAIWKVNGVVDLLFNNEEIIFYSPKTIKKMILSGKSTKEELRKEINKKYKKIKFNNNDESDSFAVALTYFIKERGLKLDQ